MSVSEEEYEKALDTVQKYDEQINLKFVIERVCCVCEEKVIKPLHEGTTKPLKQEQGMWLGGVVERVSFGYGSRHDMDSYYIAMCDDCIEDLEEKGLATNLSVIRKEME